ncbi:MAG: CpsD/CapB family tyrosine-protein kinase [Blastocatellales bacterium]
MTRVFEALQREQERKKNEASRDPLAAETGAPPDALEDEPKTDSEIAATEFELPSVIGSPVAPRSNDGMVLPAAGKAPGVESATSGKPGKVDVVNGHAASITAPATAPATAPHPNNSANGNAHNEAPTSNHLPDQATGNQAASRVVGDIRSRQTETQRLREELSLHAVARASREIPIERLVTSRLHQRLIVLTEPTAPECEQYRTLRTQLFHAAEKRQTQIVVITSALAGEGKTSTTLNLALAVAQSKENRVLVIDGDLRRPNVATYLGMRPKVGLSEVLKGEVETLDSIVCLDEPELYVLPISRESANPTELLSSERFAETVRELRDYFDFILIDSPPVMPFADARLLSNHSDAVILVVRAEKAPYETVEKAVEVLPSGRILGVVLNDAQHIRETDYYDYYYSYTQREQRRRTLLGKLSSRVRDSWLGRKIKL